MFRWVRLSLILLACSCANQATAAWSDRQLGGPLIETIDPRVLQGALSFWSMAQHPRDGTIYVGAPNLLLRFDGAHWESTPLPDVNYPHCLSIDPENSRVWVGGDGNLGYIDVGNFASSPFVSLRDRLPLTSEQLGSVWGCRASAGRIDFIATNAVLRWDGSHFQVWKFPTTQRLYPIEFEGALWFHHMESGLYRLDPQGPVLQCNQECAPDAGIFHLQREGSGLAAGSNDGLVTLTPKPSRRSLTPESLNGLTQTDRLVSVTPLLGGYQAWTTLRSVTLLSPERKIVRRLDSLSGISGNIWGQFLDRDGYLWIFNDRRLIRLDVTGAVAGIPLGSGKEPPVDSITLNQDGTALVCANGRVYRVRPGTSAETILEADALPPLTRNYHQAQKTPFGLLLAHARSVAALENGQERKILEIPSRGILSIQISKLDSARYLIGRSDGISIARRDPTGTWNLEDHLVENLIHGDPIETRDGNLWLSGMLSPPLLLRQRDGQLERPVPAFEPGSGIPQSGILYAREDDAVFLANRRLFILRADKSPQSVPLVLPVDPIGGEISADGRRLYLRFARATAPNGFGFGIARVDIAADGRTASWHDLNIRGLGTIGQPTFLTVSQENGTDTLWIGGSTGLMQARIAEIPEWRAPRPPTITLLDSPRDSAESSRFHWQEKIRLSLGSTEIADRAALRFQVQLGTGEWSEPSDRTLHEFTNITDGSYTFAARAVNPTGQTSEPSFFSFVVLPPWYRSPWAYAGYAALFVAALLGAIRYRERRILARNLELQHLVDERTAELVKANAAKDDFLASMSHEIRNPMNGVVGLSAAIDISHLDEEGRYRFGLLRHCATHLASLLEDILDFSKLQAGTIELDPQPFSPGELLDAVSAITSPVSAAAGVKVEFALGPSVPPRLIGDARRIRQVLLNYVTNAIKYAPEGDIDVTVWARTVGDKNAMLTFAVSDAGPGIPADEQERIFEKFERGAGARSNRIPGTGMGLAVCRRLATKMGGNAWVESAPGEGSTFYLSLELPIAAPVALDTATQAIVDLPKLALVVDDEDYNLVTLATMLERRGFKVLRASNAESTLAALGQHPDVVFLDYDMPDTTGPALAKRIRQAAAQRQPLIIATTAYSTVEKRRECLAAGMDGFLSKPIGEERLGAALAEAVHSRSPGDARHFVLPTRDSFDPLENLQTLARQHAQTLEAELAEFSTAARGEFEDLHSGLAAKDSARSARAAHKLAGRFGFLHAAAVMKRALQLERICQRCDWEAARPLATELTQDWVNLHDTLARLSRGSA